MPDIQTVLTIKDRINLALERSGKSQRELARVMKKSSAAVSEMLSKPGDLDSIAYVEAASNLTGYRFEWLRTGQGPERDEENVNIVEDVSVKYLKGDKIRPVAVTVDRAGRELISYVPVKAQAGYRRGFGDPQYIEKLPAYSLPISVPGTHRMFQVDGNSMRQLGGGGLHDGDIVIARYVEDVTSIKDGRVYVIVTSEGVIVKRCINRLRTDDRVLVANSDNKSGDYPPIVLHPHEILEVWELKAFISKQLSLATDLWDVLNDMQVKMAMMDDEIKRLREKLIGASQ